MMTQLRPTTLLTSLVLIGWLLLPGCSSSEGRPHVQGQVTYEGQPVVSATLALYSEGEGSDFFTHRIALMPDGSFSALVPLPGTYKVVIEESLAVQEGGAPSVPRLKIPAKYRQRGSSDVTWTIQPGDNVFKLDLKN